MKIISVHPIFLALLICGFTTSVAAQPERDGQLFDQGRNMQSKSTLAHEDLDKMKSLLGQWDVVVTTHQTDSSTSSSEGMADISYMNRGYAYMSRVHIPAYDDEGNEANFIQFLTFNPPNAMWAMGEANSYTESISLYNGDFQGQDLVLTTGVRQGGGLLLTLYRVVYAFSGENSFSITLSSSTDHGIHWASQMEQVYSRREFASDFMVPREDTGKPSPDRPAETEQFDFLIGEWSAAHKINQNGQWIQFATNATAVYAMNGHAILEHSWFNVDPNLPDAATSIIRLYNRSMRRWESLYLNNRNNSPLFFGGQKEGDTLVLHNFETNTSNSLLPRYIFHDISEKTYAWYAENSTDRGNTFNKTWTITFTKP